MSQVLAYSDFQMWSATHFYTLVIIAAITAGILILGKWLTPNKRHRLCQGIAWCILGFYLFEYAWRFSLHPWEHVLEHELPLHFCAIMALLCFIALWWEPRWARSLVYFGVLSASVQGLLTPAITYGFPRVDFFIFFISHGLLMLAALSMPLLTDWKAKAKDPLRSVLLMNAYLVVIHPINLLLGSNYGYTTAAPSGSILETLGTPAPWYYLWLELPALGLFYLMYLFVRRKAN